MIRGMRMQAVAMVLTMLVLGGCASSDRPIRAAAYPPDFSLLVHVPHAAAAGQRGRLYMVGPDRRLRAASGPGATPDRRPPVTAQLSRRQMQQVWRQVEPIELIESNDAAAVRLTVTAHGDRRRGASSSRPETLLRTLRELAGLPQRPSRATTGGG